MTKNNKKPGGWKAVRQQLAGWDKPALLVLVKDLYEADDVNRDLVDARCHPEEFSGATLEKYQGKIVEQFFPARGFGKLKLGEARKAIHDYRKATGNLPGTADLLMTYVENGTRFTRKYGDIDERFYNSMESALQELATLLRGEARSLVSPREGKAGASGADGLQHRLGIWRFRHKPHQETEERTRRPVSLPEQLIDLFLIGVRSGSCHHLSLYRLLASHALGEEPNQA